MATVKDEQIALGEAERKLTEKQTLLEKRKLEYDETVVKKEYLIARVSFDTLYLIPTALT